MKDSATDLCDRPVQKVESSMNVEHEGETRVQLTLECGHTVVPTDEELDAFAVEGAPFFPCGKCDYWTEDE